MAGSVLFEGSALELPCLVASLRCAACTSRIKAKRAKGEWFLLAREDVAAFKRRKFM